MAELSNRISFEKESRRKEIEYKNGWCVGGKRELFPTVSASESQLNGEFGASAQPLPQLLPGRPIGKGVRYNILLLPPDCVVAVRLSFSRLDKANYSGETEPSRAERAGWIHWVLLVLCLYSSPTRWPVGPSHFVV